VTDSHASWNNGLFVINVSSDGGASAELVELLPVQSNPDTEDTSANYDLACDISTLSAMFMGYKRPSYMSSIERLRGGETAVLCLEALIPVRTTYLPDFF
jgi:predicted acetyltransferase